MEKVTFKLIFIYLLFTQFTMAQKPWENLIKSDLSNWVQLNGRAPYVLKDGIITGTAVESSITDASFLCTKENFSNFILEFDSWIDTLMNSGVQFRSESRSDYREGMVFGYQFELDPTPRAWSGGIYDQTRRLWLYTLDLNQPARKAFKNGEWNHCRIEAIGNSIRTWVNGIPCADLVDDVTHTGFIGLQIHGIGDDHPEKIGIQAKWKNMRIITKDPEKYVTPYQPVIPQVSYLNNVLTQREQQEGWKLLWDGKTTNGWRGAKLTTFSAEGWEIKDGVLSTFETGGAESAKAGDIVTVDKYKDFILNVDFKYTPGANSGIKYFVNTELNKGEGSSIGCEYQILDDKLHPDAQKGKDGNRTLSGLYDLIPPIENKPDNGTDLWNRATIIVKGNHVEHWLNGRKTVEYDRGNDTWRALVAQSKYKIWSNFGEASEGNILLQEHGNMVSFRNIKIKVLE